MKRSAFTLLFLSLFLFTGCDDSADPVTSDMHEDFDHEHPHQHTGDDDHDHEHEDNFKGSHTHEHGHSHRHGKPLHGGKVVSIGHTHHKDGANHFHAEIMPVTDDVISFYVQTESKEGEPIDFEIADKEIAGMVSPVGKESLSATVVFLSVGDGDQASQFAVKASKEFELGDKLRVVIPKIRLEGERQTFSFTIERKAAEASTSEQPAADNETPTTSEPGDE